MNYNLSGLRLVTLEGLGNTNESKKKFDRDKWCAGKTNFECKAGELFNIFLEGQKEVPLFEQVLTNPYYLCAIMQKEIPFVMTDKHKNTHIVGYMDDDMQVHTHFKNLWETGALFKGNDKDVVVGNANQMVTRDRLTGNNWYENTAKTMVNGNPISNIPNLASNLFYQTAKKNENNGYNPIPYFYIFKDVATYDFWDVTKIVANAVMAIGSTFLPVVGSFLTPAVTNGVQSLIKLGDKFAKDPSYRLGFEDFQTIVVDGFAPIVGLDSEFNKIMNKVGITEGQKYIDGIVDLSKTAYKSYRAIQQFDANPTGALLELGKTLEVDGQRTLNYLQKDLKLGNVVDVAKAIKKPIAEAEKIINQMTNSEIVNSLVTQFKKFDLKSTVNGALQQLPTQQFLVDIQAGLRGGIEELTGAIPNSPGIISAISQSVNLSVDEFAGLLSIPLNLPINNLNVFDQLTIDAMVEKAKSYAMANIPFVLPSNLSEDMQKHLVNYIPRVVTNADVRTVSVKPKFYMEFL